ncbi:MAG: transcriptional regulator [Bacillota bacterium]
MVFGLGIGRKTVKELRKNQGLTARELAFRVKVDTVEIMKVDDMRIKDLPEPLKTKLLPVLRGDFMDKIPWL